MSLTTKTPGVDIDEIMSQVRERIAARKADGAYRAYDLSLVAAREMDNIRIDQEHLYNCLPDLWRASNVDLGDFPIPAKAPLVGGAVVALKKLIWKMLKFYTYRLFSQQKEYNARSAVLIQAIILKQERTVAELEERIRRLEESQRD